MNEALQTKGVEAYFADASDPLHKAFIAKAAVHSGPGGRPLIGEEAEKAIDSHYDTPRSGRSLAYIHVPFCETRCLYCMFYQNPWKEEATTEYAKQLVKELELWSDRAAQNAAPINALYFGGGTPSLYAPAALKGLLDHAALLFDCSGTTETTLEANPDDLTENYLDGLREAGIDRLSIGIQSFDDGCLKLMNRRHTAAQAIGAVRAAQRAGFGNITADLIFGIPGFGGEVHSDLLLRPDPSTLCVLPWRPAASQKAMRINFTSSSAAYCLISSTEYCILSPPFRYGFRMHAR